MQFLLNLYLRSNTRNFIAAYDVDEFHKKRLIVCIDTANLRYFYLSNNELYAYYYEYDTTNFVFYNGVYYE